MKKFLVKENANYADEFDCEGFMVVKAESKKVVPETILKDRDSNVDLKDWPKSFSFGTNEELEFNSMEEFEEALEIKEISEEDLKILKKYFPNCERRAFGTTGIL